MRVLLGKTEYIVKTWVRQHFLPGKTEYIVKTWVILVFSEITELGYRFIRERNKIERIVEGNRAFEYYSCLCIYLLT